MTKIDVDDLTGMVDDDESFEGMMVSQEEAFASRIVELRGMGEDMPVDAGEVESLPTSVLIMSIVKFPELVEEIGIAMGMSAGDPEAQLDLIKTVQCLNAAFAACTEEVDTRIPARAEPAEEE